MKKKNSKVSISSQRFVTASQQVNLDAPRGVLYARVSTEEQTRGNYPSCESQIQELQAFAARQGCQVVAVLRDDGYSAGSLKRPALTRLRQMVQDGEMDIVYTTWYDRLTRSRDFYKLDAELKENAVDFKTMHDPIEDRHSAAGEFMETMLVGAKTYERRQTAEKVTTKMAMKREEGYCNSGVAPFGFVRDATTDKLLVDDARLDLLNALFRIYIEEQSDTAVKRYLEAHGIPTARGNKIWSPGSVRTILTNRRYIAEIEMNPRNKGLRGVPFQHAYRIVPSHHAPLVSVETFELAQSIRAERAARHPNAGGKHRRETRVVRTAHGEVTNVTGNRQVRGQGRDRGTNRGGYVYLLQDLMTCGCCGRIMSSHYVYHKPGGQRKTESFIHHYVCANYRKNSNVGHKNRILARKAEQWLLERIKNLVNNMTMVEAAIERARADWDADREPQRAALAEVRVQLKEVAQEKANLLAPVRAGQVPGSLLKMLIEDADRLEARENALRAEAHRLEESLIPIERVFDTESFISQLRNFTELLEARPEEIKQLLKLIFKEIIWSPDGKHRLRYYAVAGPSARLTRCYASREEGIANDKSPASEETGDWFDVTHQSGCPQHRSFAPGFTWLQIAFSRLRRAIGAGNALRQGGTSSARASQHLPFVNRSSYIFCG